MKKTSLFVLAAMWAVLAGAVSGQTPDIQGLIDAAVPGEVISVPAGTYQVNLIVKEGVILEGAGAEVTLLDGGGKGPVIVGETGSIVKGFTITNGIEGVKLSGSLMGVFENVITANRGSGIRSGGGDCVIVNNSICRNQGPAGIDVARSEVLAANNNICGENAGFLFWESPNSTVVNNVIAFSEVGLLRDDKSAPDIDNNIFWENGVDFTLPPLEGENYFQDPILLAGEDGVCRLAADSPAAEWGVPVEGLPEELTGGIGAGISGSVPLEVYRGIMETVRARILGYQPLVEYELLEEIGRFGVATSFSQPDFTVGSSTLATAIEEIAAFDRESLDPLIERLVPNEPPAVEVRSCDGIVYPREKDRYAMESVFVKPESYYVSPDGRLHFVRETSFPRIRIVLPERYTVESLFPEGEIDAETGVVSIARPDGGMTEINLVLSPL
ncbi:MAG: right-handed parallel beta-helix repeat-containing protein [PVC group bacterium]